jgi:hypothetical protein
MTQIAHLDLTIKAARANQRLIQDVRTVRRCNYHLRRKRAEIGSSKFIKNIKRTPPNTTL